MQRANDMMRGGANSGGKTDARWRSQDRPRDWQEEIEIKLLAGVDVNDSGAEESKIGASQHGTSTREICGERMCECTTVTCEENVMQSALKLKRGEREGPEISREEMVSVLLVPARSSL